MKKKDQVTPEANAFLKTFLLVLVAFMCGILGRAQVTEGNPNSITGRIVDEGGNPVAGALIHARPMLYGVPGLEYETRSDEAGRFHLEDLIAGEDYSIQIWSAGFEYLNAGLFSSGTGDAVITLQSVPLQTRTGRVLQSGTGSPVEGAEVVLIGQHVYERTVVSDAQGEFSFDDVPGNVGQAVLYASKGNLRSQFVLARSNLGDVHLSLDAPAKIEGVVLSQASGDPVPGTTVTARPRFVSGFKVETTTNENGKYAFDDLPPGDYRITMTHPKWYRPDRFTPRDRGRLEPVFEIFENWFPPIEFADRKDTEVKTAAGTISSYNVVMIEGATVIGKVIGPDGNPVPNAIVTTLSEDSRYNVVRTDENGNYEIHTGESADTLLGYDASTGEGVILVPGYSARSDDLEIIRYLQGSPIFAAADRLASGAVSPLNLKEGEFRDGTGGEAVIRLSGIMSVSGYVKDTNGNPVADVNVFLPERGGMPEQTNEEGHYSLAGFPLPVTQGKDFTITFAPPRPNESGLRIINVRDMSPDELAMLNSATPPPLPSPDVQYYFHATETVTARHNRSAELNVVLQPTEQLRITGRLTGPDGLPIPQADLILYAGSITDEQAEWDLFPEVMRGGGLLLPDPIPYSRLLKRTTDEEGRFAFVTVRESEGMLYHGGLIRIKTDIDPFTFSLAIRTPDDQTKLIHNIRIQEGETQKTFDISP